MYSAEIRSAVFENDSNTVALATSFGFAIYSLSETNKTKPQSTNLLKNPFFPKGARLISTLGNSNIIALTPYTDKPNCVYIFETFSTSNSGDNHELAMCNFDEDVCGIRLRPDILVVATHKKISVRQLSDFTEIASFTTTFNVDGIFDIPATFSSSLLAFPSPDIGVVSVCNYLDSSVRTINVHAFKTPVSFIKFSENGRLLAVAGDDGKAIIVYSVPSMKQVAFLRRGITGSKLLSMSFEPHGTQLAVTSMNGTLHVFFIAWAESVTEQDPKSPSRAAIKLKDLDTHTSWVCFSAKTLKLCGITNSGQPFIVVFDDQMKQASLDMKEKLVFS